MLAYNRGAESTLCCCHLPLQLIVLQVVLGFLPVPILLVTALYLMMEVAEPVGASARAARGQAGMGCS
jgi:hypothetical protein